MDKKKTNMLTYVGAAVALGVVVLLLLHLMKADADLDVASVREEARQDVSKPIAAPAKKPPKKAVAPAKPAKDVAADEAEAAEEPLTDEEKKEAEDEAKVEAFDALTDKWMEPSEKGVTMADVDAFVREFKKVPADRKEECLQRALNLVPDENVMLLAGVLMDKSQPKELVELVFNDILNRDEDVKKPILEQVYRDKTHPCWADSAWIFDVTGEKPAAGK